MFSTAKLKSFDFVVYNKTGRNLLVAIKGRQHRSKSGRGALQTWATVQDVADLLQWQEVFGEGFTAVLLFVFWIDPPLTPEPGMFAFRDRWYVMLAINATEYRDHMRRRSAKWETVAIPQADFHSLARPIDDWL